MLPPTVVVPLNVGVVIVGLVANTFAPEPVSSVNNAAKLALVGVAKKVAAPVAKPLTPELIGRPVAFVNVPLEGVPNAPPLTTTAPAVPVLTARAVATPVPKPLTPVLIGKPVAFVNVKLLGVPPAAPTTANEPALPVLAAKAVATPVPKPANLLKAILPANIELVTAPVPIVNAVEPPVLPVPVTSPVNVNEPEIATVETAVTKPFALTVITGIAVVVPNCPTLLLTVASVNA